MNALAVEEVPSLPLVYRGVLVTASYADADAARSASFADALEAASGLLADLLGTVLEEAVPPGPGE